MKSLIVFAGAGASRGVSSKKYPMAIDFRRRLPPSITEDKTYSFLINFLAKPSSEEIDVEHILWELGKLYDITTTLSNKGSFLGNLLRTNHIQTIIPSINPDPNIFDGMAQLRNVIFHLQNIINEHVYEFYSQRPTREELEHSWLPLLNTIVDAEFENVDIVTTNYDRIIESALIAHQSLALDMGYSKDPLDPAIVLNNWRDVETGLGMLTKLHGSVDWKLGNGGTDVDPVIRRGHPEFDGDHNKRLILYPGFKGVPSNEPFVAFHNYFRRKLSTATHVLFIGFAFRDEHINDLINSALPSGSKIAVVDPRSHLPQLPFLAKASHFPNNFGEVQGDSVLSNAGKNPLDLQKVKNWFYSE